MPRLPPAPVRTRRVVGRVRHGLCLGVAISLRAGCLHVAVLTGRQLLERFPRASNPQTPDIGHELSSMVLGPSSATRSNHETPSRDAKTLAVIVGRRWPSWPVPPRARPRSRPRSRGSTTPNTERSRSPTRSGCPERTAVRDPAISGRRARMEVVEPQGGGPQHIHSAEPVWTERTAPDRHI